MAPVDLLVLLAHLELSLARNGVGAEVEEHASSEVASGDWTRKVREARRVLEEAAFGVLFELHDS